MSIKLSILDPSPIVSGHSAAEALSRTRELALAADEMDYRSFWVQEHHNTESFAGTAPEIMMADLASRTKRLQLGSGGIMLPNYSPLKVAEISTTLSALYPGRIEIGLGRATGADPRASAALLGPGADNFPQMLRMLLDWVLDASDEVPLPPDHRARGISSRPKTAKPDIWILCSSPSSAAFIGAMGLKLAFADFLNPGLAPAALSAYREAFTPSLFAQRPYAAIGLTALTAKSKTQAETLASTMLAWSAARARGAGGPFLPVAQARHQLDQTPATTIRAGIIGEANDVADKLRQLAEDSGADELFILSVTETLQDRITSYRLLNEAWRQG